MTKLLPRLAILVAAAALSLASSPSVNNAAKADVDRRIAALSAKNVDYPAPTVAEPLPLAVGQWATFKQTDQDGKPSIVTYKIVGEQDGAFWYETSMDTYFGHSAIKMLLFVGNRRDPNTFDVRAYFTKNTDGTVQEMPPATLSMVRSSFQWVLDNLVIRWDQYPQEDVQVIGGRFASAYRGRSTVQFAGMSATSDVWFHPAVPINGAVKNVGVDRPNMTMELIDFGQSGAQTEF
jgi:hypothetical protein